MKQKTKVAAAKKAPFLSQPEKLALLEAADEWGSGFRGYAADIISAIGGARK